MSLSSRGALEDDFDQVFLISSELGGNDGAVPALEGRFDWIENDLTEDATLLRLEAAKWTAAACRLGGYCINEAEIPLLRLPDLIEGTQLFASKPLKGASAWTTEFDYHLSSEVSLSDVILELSKSQPVTLLLAGNAYAVGGNFTNGGLASLEEALCIQSTLHMSLRRAAKMAEDIAVDPPRWAAKDQPFQPYIPGDGVIISPFVEFFRAGPENGFAFLKTVVDLNAVLTIAMPNCNPTLSQPVDAPKDFSKYKQLVADSITAGLQAAVAIKSPVLIIPEVGCGLQQNDPRVIGDIISDLLSTQFPNAFAQVNFFGDEPFLLSCSRVEQDAQDPFGGVEAPLRQRPRSLGSDFSDELLGPHGGSADGSGTILEAPNGLALSAATLLGDGGQRDLTDCFFMFLFLGDS